jgi:aminotransferase
MTDITPFGWDDDVAFARYLVEDVGVATVPGSSFYREGMGGRTKVRFCFSKRDGTLRAADERLERLKAPR